MAYTGESPKFDAISIINGDLSISRSASAGTVRALIQNTSNTASSVARILTQVAGASAGDPYLVFDISGVVGGSIGLDNSDSDSMKFDVGSGPPSPGSKTGLTIDQVTNVIVSNTTDNGYLKIDTLDGVKIRLSTAVPGSYIAHQTGWNVQYVAGPGTGTNGYHSFFTTQSGAYVETLRSSIDGSLFTYDTGGAASSAVEVRKSDNSSTNNDCLAFQRGATSIAGGGTTQGVLRLDGAGNFVTVTISDQRLKTNIVDNKDAAYAIVSNLASRTFDWIPADMPDACNGFISQEVQTYVPCAVADLGTTMGYDNVLGVSATSLIPILWGAVRKLIEKVKALEAV